MVLGKAFCLTVDQAVRDARYDDENRELKQTEPPNVPQPLISGHQGQRSQKGVAFTIDFPH